MKNQSKTILTLSFSFLLFVSILQGQSNVFPVESNSLNDFSNLISTPMSIEQVYFYSSSIGWAYGSNGHLLKTTNGGKQWIQQDALTNDFILKSHFVNENVGWICGLNSLLRKTTDGGKTWTVVQLDTRIDLFWIFFINENRGWIVGDNGFVSTTTDGGLHWHIQNSNTSSQLRSVVFADVNNGWACGNNGTVIHTTDGGQTWLPQITNTNIYLWWIEFVDSLHGYIAGGHYDDNSSIFLSTTDGGNNWQPHDLSQYSYPLYPLFSVDFIDKDIGWTVGRGGLILKTTDGGNSWIDQSYYPPLWFSDVYFLNKDTGYVFNPGENCKLLCTTDGGENWEVRNIYASNEFASLVVKDVPNDNGKNVFLSWKLNTSPLVLGITRFDVYRYDLGSWTYLNISVPALNDLEYQTIAPTLYDSTKIHGIYYSVFRVVARTAYPYNYWIIGPDSGYSVDNLPPKKPKNGKPKKLSDGKILLEWNKNDNESDNFQDYVIYRSTSTDFPLSAETRIASTTSTSFIDENGNENLYYKVTSRDSSGNESEPLLLSFADVTLVDKNTPTTFELSQNHPNPFNPTTIIPFSIPNQAFVTLKVYNLQGKEVATLVSENLGPGNYTREFQASNLSSGIYFYRLEAGNFSSSKKMIILK
ncbi:MAG TPA: YCF48-related protein [Bacteroidota bacterium]|nr:YCF48-related protein [Bacteroidota bacterium]